MNQFDINQFNVVEVSSSESMFINGGTYESGYSAGAAVRKYVDAALLEWQILKWIFI